MKIITEEQLRELYEWPKGRAGKKVLPELEKHSIHFIESSPFCVISTSDAKGKMDASPRGGQSGFIKVLDDRTIVIPDAKGNNRVDSLVNIIETGRIGILFLIPGIDETLRINGGAAISTDDQYLSLFPEETQRPKSYLVITIEEVFLHCAKALMRSKLWEDELKVNKEEFPTMGRMLKDQLGGDQPLETREEMIKRYLPDL